MRDLIPTGSLREMLLPPTYGRHVTEATAFTVLSVEIWTSGLVVNIHMASTLGALPNITVQDHFGTEYSLQGSATLGSRNLQVFTPSVPQGTRSLTIRSADASDARPVVTFAVPPVRRPYDPDVPKVVLFPHRPDSAARRDRPGPGIEFPSGPAPAA